MSKQKKPAAKEMTLTGRLLEMIEQSGMTTKRPGRSGGSSPARPTSVLEWGTGEYPVGHRRQTVPVLWRPVDGAKDDQAKGEYEMRKRIRVQIRQGV
jgi:hypothetical protein